MSAAVAFDVDGVLFHGSAAHPVSGAVDVLREVLDNSIPHVFITNGTGHTEASKAQELAAMVDRPIDPRAVVLPTTPMRDLVIALHGKRILAVARSPVFAVDLLVQYGFERTNVVAVQTYAARHPLLFPQKRYSHVNGPAAEHGVAWTDEPPIDAIFLLQTPDDWGEALQVCLDVVRSTGVPTHANEATHQVVRVYSGNPDFDYGALHCVPRLTLGAFRRTLEMCHLASTGRELVCELFGKPFAPVYALASRELQRQAQVAGKTIDTIYAIGDNPASDVAGARSAGRPWHSILVRTGIFRAAENDARDPADVVCETVVEAWAYIKHKHHIE